MTDKKQPITLTATPIDRSQPGSWQAIRSLTRFAAAAERGDVAITDLDDFMSMIESHVQPHDGMTLEDALTQVSFDDMIEIARAVAGGDSLGEDGDAS